MMVSGKVKGQHVLLWSVCVVCLLPALGNACGEFEFPTATVDHVTNYFIVTVAEGSRTTIPFHLKADRCRHLWSVPFILTVSKREQVTRIYRDFCKLRIDRNSSRTFGGPCRSESGKGSYSWSKVMDKSDETSWRVYFRGGDYYWSGVVRLRVVAPVPRKRTQTTTVVAPKDTTQPTTRETVRLSAPTDNDDNRNDDDDHDHVDDDAVDPADDRVDDDAVDYADVHVDDDAVDYVDDNVSDDHRTDYDDDHDNDGHNDDVDDRNGDHDEDENNGDHEDHDDDDDDEERSGDHEDDDDHDHDPHKTRSDNKSNAPVVAIVVGAVIVAVFAAVA